MEKSRLLGTLEKFKDLKIAVIGDMMLDDYIIGTVDRISPEAPVPVVSVKEERFVLGGAANVINNIATLGATAISLGVIGNDSDGDRLLNELEKKNIDISGIIRTDKRPTIVKRRIIGGNQQLLRIDWENVELLESKLEDEVIEILKSNIDGIDAVILSDYDKGVLTPKVAQEIIKIAREKNKIVVVDPKPKNALNYVGASSMTPNKKEAIECIGGKKGEPIENIGKNLREKLNLDNLLLTRSEEGMSLFGENGFETIPTYAKEVYDVTGAGDTVISVYTLAKAAGLSWYEAAKIANTAAGVVVGKMGTSTVTKEEIIEFYNRIYHEWK
jgi:rfaE bifunctional protein kinase chain/domain